LKRRLIFAVVAAVVAVGVPVLGHNIILPLVLGYNLVGEEALKESISPDGRYAARLYTLDGGATTGTYYHVDLSVEGGRSRTVFTGERLEEPNIEWTENGTLLISSKNMVKRRDIFIQMLKNDGVEISYSSGLMP